ncbi:MAG: DUF2059 domain-containing protein [Alteromonadaceae bacterium]|nr:DUF2059 domain-containing protein [Alteromonadaceae bacterium]
MKIFTVLCFLSLVAFTSHAEQKASKESVEKLMKLTEVSKLMDSMQGQIRNMFKGLSKQMKLTEKEKPEFNRYMNKISVLFENDMNWDKFKEPMINIYVKHFTEDEIQGLIKFYQSDLGKSMTKKMPLIMQDSMIMSQELMKNLMPKVQALAIEMKKNIKKSRQKIGE